MVTMRGEVRDDAVGKLMMCSVVVRRVNKEYCKEIGGMRIAGLYCSRGWHD